MPREGWPDGRLGFDNPTEVGAYVLEARPGGPAIQTAVQLSSI